MSRGKRESDWTVIRRCLAIVRRVQRGPAGREELVRAVLAQEGAEAYGGVEGRALQRRVENDLGRIRERLQIDVNFDRDAGGYAIRDTWLPLLDLPGEDLQTMAWLEQIFEQDSPQHDEVHALLGRLRSWLSPQRRGEVERCRTALEVDLGRRDEDRLSRQERKLIDQVAATCVNVDARFEELRGLYDHNDILRMPVDWRP